MNGRDYKKLEEEIAYLDFNLNRTKKELGRWTGGDLAKYKLTPESRGRMLKKN